MSAESSQLPDVAGHPPPQPWIRLVWSGDIDAFSVRPLASGLRDARELDPLILEVDLAGVTFMDSFGVRPLVETHARLPHRMRLFDPSPAVTRLLRILDLEDMFLVVGPIPARSAAKALTWQAVPDVGGQGADVLAAAESGLALSVSDRVTIEQAKGLLMAVHGCDASSAWELLRGHAKAHDVRIRVMAGMLVDNAPKAAHHTPETVMEDVMAERARAGPPAG